MLIDVLGGVKTLYVFVEYVVDNQIVKYLYKLHRKSCSTQKKQYLCNHILIIKKTNMQISGNEEPEILFAKKVLKKTMKDGWKVIMAIFALMLLMFVYHSFFGANDSLQNGKDSQEMKSDHSGERWIPLPFFFR